MQVKTLGDYTIIKQIGQGTLGSVFLAEHRFMKKQYALKVLPVELSQDRTFIQRFEEEVGLLTALDHPNIIKVYNVSFAEGQFFLVTDCIVDEYGETTNLAQYLLGHRQSLTEEQIFNLLTQVAEALDYAHQPRAGGNGLVHRGVKLNNILVSKGNNGIQLFLSDFGLSRVVGTGTVLSKTFQIVAETLGANTAPTCQDAQYPSETADTDKLIPLHASFLQNFAFLAPEQKRLDATYPVDAKADTYAFGILAYYLLTRQFPEGYFDLPSKMDCNYEWNWDDLIKSCLSGDPSKRPTNLKETLEQVKQKPHQPEVKPYVPPIADPIKEEASTPHPVAEALMEQTVSPEVVEIEPVYETKPREPEQEPCNKLRPIIHTQQLERPEHDPDPAKVFEVDPTVKHYEPEKKEEKNIEPILTDMVVVPGGSFIRGSNDGNRDEMPKHQVNIQSFAIDTHPITNEQFIRFLEAMGGEKDSHHRDIIRLRDSRIKRSGGKLSIESGYLKHPVVGVTWYGAVAYAKWIGKRLPTEAEWEIAASGAGDNMYYPTGDDIEKNQANFFSSDTIAVMSYPPNQLGIYDLAGNVYEWCHDWYGYNYYEVSVQEPDNPKGPLQGVYRVLKGGCWKSLKEDLRCSRRHRNNPGTVNSTYGFRCATDVVAD